MAMDGWSAVTDAHHHVWDPRRRDYPWMTPEIAALRRPFGPRDLERETRAAGVSATVLVQTVSDTAETWEFLDLARRSDGLVAGVVGWVDLTGPHVDGILAGLREASGGAGLVGIRHQVQDEPDPNWLCRPEVLRGLRAVARHGLAYDLLVRARELPAAVEACRRVEELTFVVDHAAKPGIAAGEWEPWYGRLRTLAALPSVVCKVSGLVTEAAWDSWSVAELKRYVNAVLELFGPDRLMWGSDWPVCTLAASCGEVLALARECLAGLSAAQSRQVFDATARRVYRLPSRHGQAYLTYLHL